MALEQWEKEEEFYRIYQSKISDFDEESGDIERRINKLQEDREEFKSICVEDRGHVENLLNMWGDCAESGNLLDEFEESIEEENRELQKAEEKLTDERNVIKKKRILCEESYEKDKQKLSEKEEEGETWQE